MDQRQMITITSPLDSSELGKVYAMTKEDIDEIVIKAKNQFQEWRAIPLNERCDILYKAADILVQKEEELSALLVKEVGKDKKSAKSEVLRTADFIRFTIETAKNIHGESINGDSFAGYHSNKFALVEREPMGVVLAISPFNYPINLAASKIAPALVAGNTVIFKPATMGSLCGVRLREVFVEAGVPEDALITVTGRGSDIGDYLIQHEGISFINFTGSTEVGQDIAKKVTMKPLLMELGGKDAAIVLADANLDLTAKNIVSGAFSYSGQRCTAVKRVLVLDEVADALVEKIITNMEKLKIGNPLEGDVDIVPLINKKAADFVEELMEEATNKGAEVRFGGKREGNLIYPTLFDHVSTDMRIAWEEPFGPILPIIRVRCVEEAIEIANKSEYGLQSAVFTENINNAFHVARRLEVGMVQVNNKTERGPDHFPFMGVKNSGIGVQGIRYSIEAMTRIKGIVVNLHE